MLDRVEILDFPLPPHHEGQRRRLDPSDGQHRLSSRTPRRQRISAGKVHADQPIRPGAGQRRHFQRREIPVVAQVGQGLLHALLVERVQKQPLHRLPVADEVQHLVHQELPLPVRVARVDDLVGLRDQILYDPKLLRAGFGNNQLPRLRHDRQHVFRPFFIGRVVLLRLRLPQDMAVAPGHDAFRRLDEAVAAPRRPLQAFRDLAAHARLLRYI